MKSHNIMEILDELRTSVDLSKTLPLLAATAVIQAKNNEELISLVQSNTFTEKTILKQFIKIADKEKLDVPVAVLELNELLSSISRPVLQNYIFKCVDYFKLGTATTFFDEAIQIVSNVGGKQGALATTSAGINTLAIKILDVQPNDSYLDPTCGYGGAIQLVLDQNPHQIIVGQELNDLVADIAKMRSFVSGATNTQIFTGDVLGNPLYLDKMGLMKFDRLYSDAPIGVKYENLELLEHDPYNRFMYGLPPKSRVDWAFMSNGISSLSDTGRGVFLTSIGPLFRAASEKKIRERLLTLDLVEAVVELAPGLLTFSAIPVALLIINKKKSTARKGKVMFVNAEKIVTDNKIRVLSESNINDICDALKNEKNGVSKLVEIREIEDANLSPSRYVFQSDIQDEIFGTISVDLTAFNKSGTIELQEIADVKRGYNVTSRDEEIDGTYAIIKINDVRDGDIDFTDLTRCNIPGSVKVDNYLVKKGDLLLQVRGEGFKTAVIKEDRVKVLFTQNFVCIRPKEKINAEWLQLFFESPIGRFQLQQMSSGSVVQLLQISDVSRMKIPHISFNEQKGIAQRYAVEKEKIQKEIDRLYSELKKIRLEAYEKMGLESTFHIQKQ